MTAGLLLKIVVVYIAVIFAAVVAKRGYLFPKSYSEYVLGRDPGSKGLSPFLMLATYAATSFSAYTIVGLPGFVYTHGIGAFVQVISGTLLSLIVVVVIGRTLQRKSQEYSAVSPVAILFRTYGSRPLAALIIISMFVFIMPHFSVQIIGIGRLISSITGENTSYIETVGVLLVVLVVYSWAGGFRAIAYTDAIQLVIMSAALFLVGGYLIMGGVEGLGLNELGPALGAVERSDLLTVPGPELFYTFPMLLSVVLFVGLWPLGHPAVSIRLMAPRKPQHITWIVRGMVLITFVLFVPAILLGLFGAARFEGLESGDLVVGSILREYFIGNGPWLFLIAVMFLMGVLAASMSTADSQALALGTIFSSDVIPMLVGEDVSDNGKLWITRAVTALIVFGGFLIGLNPPDLIIELSILSASGTAVLAPTVLGIMLSRPKAVAAIFSILAGYLTLGGLQYGLGPSALFGFHNGVWAIAVAFIIFGGVHAATRDSRTAVQGEGESKKPSPQ